MFSFFKKKKSVLDLEFETKFILEVFTKLEGYGYLVKAINEGLIKNVVLKNEVIENFRKTILDVDLLNKYQNKSAPYLFINGIKVKNHYDNQVVDVCFHVFDGLVLGYSLNKSVQFVPDLKEIDVSNSWIKLNVDDEFYNLQKILPTAILEKINQTEVFSLIFKGEKLYHIKELEDGDFIAVNDSSKFFKISHDPLEANVIEGDIIKVLSV